MTCEITFLPVGNADSIIVKPENGAAVIIDLPDLPLLRKWFDRRQENHISRIYITHAHRDHFAPLTKFVNFLENWIKVGGRVDTLCFPDGVLTLRAATDKVKSNRGENSCDSQRKDPLQDTLLKLKELTKTGLKILSANRDDNPYEDNLLHIKISTHQQYFLLKNLAGIMQLLLFNVSHTVNFQLYFLQIWKERG